MMAAAITAWIPCKHDSRCAADEGVELPTAVAQSIENLVRRHQEDGVGIDRRSDGYVGDAGNLLRKVRCTLIRMRGILEPSASLEHADPRRGEEAHLRRELAGLFAAVIEIDGERGVEEQDCLAHGHSVFCSAQAENIHAAFPTELCRREAKMG